VISSLRRIDGVQRVSLSSSEKLTAAGSSGKSSESSDSAGATSNDCRNGNGRFPQFSMTLFFNTPKP
jgi:hypothetical protein